MEMKLECAVYGEKSVFPVKITRDAKVSALQEAIFDKKRYKERYSFDGSDLTLYLAKKDDAWLNHDYSVEDVLQRKIDSGYKKMLSSRKLDDDEYFKKKFQPGDKEIHVLVELPEAAAGEKLRKRYVHSEMSSNEGKALLHDLNIRVKPVGTVAFTARNPAPVQGFKWDSVCDGRGQNIALTEEQQRERYREYVEHNIGDVLAEKKLCVLGVEKGNNILSVAVPSHDIDLVGKMDILVLSALAKQFPHYVELLPDVKMLIEVKKVVKAGSSFQALSELIALDFLVDDPVMALLTNLTDHWQFFWVSEKNNNYVIIQTTTVTEPGAAFAVIRTLLAHSPTDDADITLPCFEKPIKRRKLAKVLPTISEVGESSGIRAAIERYYDIASVLGPDIDMARAAANQIARTIPVFSYYT
ncbi:CRN-like protein [Plasmopara halstedii]|uniref:CRN-like protein n=1 Tax=Plasmopara halstedii TaxID=4781 RepID=A0A0N7L3Q8_PLAHL|nr:CRN-like protein [Plasmopara halstedii]CEG36555.1 CRN-like protein [Plasmopara halstedii]|eukprot:XP_024572924.1 CRN-like protein [Plasmopara halstedii]